MVNCRFRIKKDSDVIKALIGDDNVSYDVTKHRPKSIMIRSKEDVWSTDLENKIIYAGYNQVADSTTLVLERWTVFGLQSVGGKQAWFKVGIGTLDQVEEPTDYTTAINKIIILRDPVIDGRYGLTEANSKSPNEGIDEMDATETLVDVCDGGGEQFKDKARAVELPTTDWYEVEAYVHFPGADRVSRLIHEWFAGKMLAENPDIFTYCGQGDYRYRLVEIGKDGAGKILTNEPNLSKVSMGITLNERTTYYKSKLTFVTSDNWEINVHKHYTESEEEKQRALELDKNRQRRQQELMKLERIEQETIEKNTPKVFEGPIVEWELQISNMDIPIGNKIAAINKILDSKEEIYGWWDGEMKFRQYPKDLRAISLPDFRVISIHPESRKVSIQEFTNPPGDSRNTHMLGFAFLYNQGTVFEDREISGILGAYPLDRAPFELAQREYDEQQAVLKSIRGE